MKNNRGEGYSDLWDWFGLSYASFLVIPRVLMHEMPDEWQGKMAELLLEYDETFDQSKVGVDSVYVSARKDNKFASIPDWLKNYRHPNHFLIKSIRKDSQE